jgi:hypothetical protein
MSYINIAELTDPRAIYEDAQHKAKAAQSRYINYPNLKNQDNARKKADAWRSLYVNAKAQGFVDDDGNWIDDGSRVEALRHLNACKAANTKPPSIGD